MFDSIVFFGGHALAVGVGSRLRHSFHRLFQQRRKPFLAPGDARVYPVQRVLDRGLPLLQRCEPLLDAVQPLVEAHELDDDEQAHRDVGADEGERRGRCRRSAGADPPPGR